MHPGDPECCPSAERREHFIWNARRGQFDRRRSRSADQYPRHFMASHRRDFSDAITRGGARCGLM